MKATWVPRGLVERAIPSVGQARLRFEHFLNWQPLGERRYYGAGVVRTGVVHHQHLPRDPRWLRPAGETVESIRKQLTAVPRADRDADLQTASHRRFEPLADGELLTLISPVAVIRFRGTGTATPIERSDRPEAQDGNGAGCIGRLSDRRRHRPGSSRALRAAFRSSEGR